MSHSTTRIGAKSRRRLRRRRRHDEAVKLRRGGEGYWHSGSDDPKVADAHGLPDRFGSDEVTAHMDLARPTGTETDRKMAAP